MPSHQEVISSRVVTHERRGVISAYGKEFKFSPHSAKERREARTLALKHGCEVLATLEAQKGEPLSLYEEQHGCHERPPVVEGPKSARQELAAQGKIPDSDRVDGILKTTNLDSGQIDRRAEALGRAKFRLQEKENRATQQQADANDPRRKYLVDFAEKVRASKVANPKSTADDVIKWSDIARDAKNPNKSIGDVWQTIRNSGVETPAVEVGETL